MNLRWGDSLAKIDDMGGLELFKQWHLLDPVDDFERNRNNVIYTYQGNRNPFIDYPEFVGVIWGTTPEPKPRQFLRKSNVFLNQIMNDNIVIYNDSYKTYIN